MVVGSKVDVPTVQVDRAEHFLNGRVNVIWFGIVGSVHDACFS